jgi:hypothetical protein
MTPRLGSAPGRLPAASFFAALYALLLALAGAPPVLAQEASPEEPAAATVEDEEAGEEAAPAPPPLRRPGFQRPGERRSAPGTDTEVRPRRPVKPGPTPGSRPEISTDEEGDEAAGPRRAAGPPLERPDYGWIAVPDRWRIVEEIGVNERWYDPYHQNTLKGDRPIFDSQDWFFRFDFLSDTTVEPRNVPVPAGIAVTSSDCTRNDIYGCGNQLGINQNWIASFSLIKGDTAFKPPDWEFRISPAANVNQVYVEEAGLVNQDPTGGKDRFDWHLSVTELFVDKHLWNKSDRYDFDSLRAGVQPFNADFRGFLFIDNNPGVRLFGNAWNNRVQYNLAWFRRLEKDTNSGLPILFDFRDDDVIIANAYYQDFPVMGFTVEAVAAYNRNRENDDTHDNTNGFRERPAPFGDAQGTKYDIGYLGLNGDGHIDRFNLNWAAYWAFGRQKSNPVAGRGVDVSAFLVAAEGSVDFDWYRLKAFGLFQSGDDDPKDSHGAGFDAIFENPNFAGAATSYWVRQNVPFVFGGSVALSGRNGILNTLRTSKDEGQSNFVNPGLGLVGVGADFDVLPELRVLANVSWLNFVHTEPLEYLRVQPGISNEIGWDLSAAVIYRPLFIENVVFNVSFATLIPGTGFRDLYPDDFYYSALANVVLRY